MLRKVFLSLPVLALAMCLLSGTVFASDPCSPTNPNVKNSIVQIPADGTPKTPAGGVADGWVLLYKDSSFTQLTHEVYCRNNKIEFAGSVGGANFQADPDCTQAACSKAAESGNLRKATLKSDAGSANNFVFAAKKNAFGLTAFTNLYTFPISGLSGWDNNSGLVQDASGNLYGTAANGGPVQTLPERAYGVVFEISPAAGGGATETSLHNFISDTTDGYKPFAGLTFDSAGNLWGTTSTGGGTGSAGTLFELTPGTGGTWNYSVAYRFNQSGTAGGPGFDGLTLNPSGGFYNAGSGGTAGYGEVWSLNSSLTTLTDLYDSPSQNVGNLGGGGYLGSDSAGNLYGTTSLGGGLSEGLVYQVNPSTGNLTELYSFTGGLKDGCDPAANPVLDASGNIYGTTTACTVYGGGTTWKLTPAAGGTYIYSPLYNFCGNPGNGFACPDGYTPQGGVVTDSFGNIYGTTAYGGDMTCGTATGSEPGGCGVLYELSPAPSGGCPSGTYEGIIPDTNTPTGWCETVLHTFELATDGGIPLTAVIFGTDGNIYGTTSASYNASNPQDPIASNFGTVWGYPMETLTVTLAGGGTGTVVATSPTSINCPGICSGPFSPGTVVTLLATAKTGFTFRVGAEPALELRPLVRSQ